MWLDERYQIAGPQFPAEAIGEHDDSHFLAAPAAGVLLYVYRYNLVLGIFNLIPLPPLDGGHFLPYFLPSGLWTVIRPLEQYGPFILILLVITGATGYIIGPVLS